MESAVRYCAILTVFLTVGLTCSSTEARVEAVKGKKYPLTKEHGPWMIMVTSLWGETKEQYERANKAADELVYELRNKGIPAYTFAQDSQIEHLSTLDRFGREQRRVYAAQRNMIGILAGNYETVDHSTAQKTLKWMKTFRPKSLEVPGQPGAEKGQGPLSKAFLTINPLLEPEEVARRNRDPLLLKLNSGTEFSLAENKHKYSLVVASFYGKSAVKPQRFAEFDQQLKGSASLDVAGMEAWQLVKTMRAQGLEAYVYHDRFRSIVTVGGFDSPEDPGIKKWHDMFCAKVRRNPETDKDVLVSESIQVPGKNKGDRPLKDWAMDPYPQLIEVPRLR